MEALNWQKTCLMMSGTLMSWKIRQLLVRVKNHSQGRSTAR